MSHRIIYSLFLGIVSSAVFGDQSARIEVVDLKPFHAHAEGVRFKVSVKTNVGVEFLWQDFTGSPLGESGMVGPGKIVELESPSTDPGYYGLVFRALDENVALPDRIVGETREYGFAVLNADVERTVSNAASQFGLVHAKMEDPASPTWIKTLTWKTFGTTRGWARAKSERARMGKIELPIVSQGAWRTSEEKPITRAELSVITNKMLPLLGDCREPLYLELGLEENLRGHFGAKHYWANLSAKINAVRLAAEQAQCDVRLIYQIAGLHPRAITKFAQSEAAKQFDILSLHPYAWPNFPDPGEWLVEHLSEARSIMSHRNLNLPIWFTEVGAPHHGNYPGGFFGYPKGRKKVEGLSRSRAVSFMVQLHAIAFAHNVRKIFWYNYKDRGLSREKAEANFGLVDYWGFPKPAYAGYYNLKSQIGGKIAKTYAQTKNGIHYVKFDSDETTLWIIWSAEGISTIPLGEIDPALNDVSNVRITNAVGTPVAYTETTMEIGQFPLFVSVNQGDRNRGTLSEHN